MFIIISFISFCLNFIFITKWGIAEGNIDNIIHYLGINYPDALEGIRKDYIVKLGHAPKHINSGKKNLYTDDLDQENLDQLLKCENCEEFDCEECFINSR